MEVGTQIFVNWYGHVVAGTVASRDKHFESPIFNDWIAVNMEVPASDGKPIKPGLSNICAYHKNHVYLTEEAAAEAWRKYQERWQKEYTKPACQTHTPQQPDCEDWLAESRAFLKLHWNAERNHIQTEYIEEYMRIFAKEAAEHNGYHVEAILERQTPKLEQQTPKPVKTKSAELAGNYAQKPAGNIRRKTRRKKNATPPDAIQLTFDF